MKYKRIAALAAAAALLTGCAEIPDRNMSAQTSAGTAEASGTVAIGCDTDQAGESETVITSAIKELGKELGVALDSYYNDTFKGGIVTTVGVKDDAVGLAIGSSRMTKYTADLYAEQYQMMKDDVDGMYSSLINFGQVADLNELASKMTNITVTVIAD